jgi:uncharacterized protein YbaR (Trm112 family)
MISPELLQLLRCPLDPQRTTVLEEAPEGLVCQRCRVIYPIREGIPCMLVDEASLPQGCDRLDDLPCQHATAPHESPS